MAVLKSITGFAFMLFAIATVSFSEVVTLPPTDDITIGNSGAHNGSSVGGINNGSHRNHTIGNFTC